MGIIDSISNALSSATNSLGDVGKAMVNPTWLVVDPAGRLSGDAVSTLDDYGLGGAAATWNDWGPYIIAGAATGGALGAFGAEAGAAGAGTEGGLTAAEADGWLGGGEASLGEGVTGVSSNPGDVL